MSDSSRPHGLQPIRLLHPWDFPDKSTGVGCSSNLNSVRFSHSVMSNSSRPHGLQPTRFLCPCDFPDKSTGGGCIAFSTGCGYMDTKTMYVSYVHILVYTLKLNRNIFLKKKCIYQSNRWKLLSCSSNFHFFDSVRKKIFHMLICLKHLVGEFPTCIPDPDSNQNLGVLSH